MKRAEIEILPDGTMKAEAIDFEGKGCEVFLQELTKGLKPKSKQRKKEALVLDKAPRQRLRT